MQRSAAAVAERQAASKRSPGPKRLPAKRGYERRDDGLDYLHKAGKITGDQEKTGRRYGELYRWAVMESGAALKSCLDDSKIRMALGGGMPAGVDYSLFIIEARRELALAGAHLDDVEYLVNGLGLVCGQGFRPREILPVQREAEQLENSLRVALDLLAKYFQKRDARDRR